MNLQSNIETYATISAIALSLIGSYFILRRSWRHYGLLFLLAAIVGNIFCYLFIKLGFYSFPYRLFPQLSAMPFDVVSTAFPFLVILGVCYSPTSWAYKIPFYWVIIHLGMFAETLVQNFTDLISYDFHWDFWDSYTWWWLYLLIFDYVGGLFVPSQLKSPITTETFRYGNWFWFVLHFVLILTIFLGGYYLGFIKQ